MKIKFPFNSKVILMHVAADSSNKGTVGISGPVFPQNKFEFIPIRDGKKSSEKRTYSTIPAKNKRFGKNLADFVPNDVKDKIVHYDPDFENFTYAEPLSSDYGSSLKNLELGDYIFFIASLAPFDKHAYNGTVRKNISRSQKRKMAKYLIGYFQIKLILKVEKNKNGFEILNKKTLDKKTLNQLEHNAHFKRISDKFIIAIGKKNRKTALLSKAIKITKDGAPFSPNSIGRRIYGNKNYNRGRKIIVDKKQIKFILGQVK